jgi:hypothetical protein
MFTTVHHINDRYETKNIDDIKNLSLFNLFYTCSALTNLESDRFANFF